MRRVVRFSNTGGAEVLRVLTEELADPEPGEVLVRHSAVGVNFIDIYHRNGLYPVPTLPSEIGMEAAGVVTAIGDAAPASLLGKRVAYAGGKLGAYASERWLPASRLVVLPDDIDEFTAAGGLLKGMTVEYLIRRTYPVAPGETVLLHAAAGGVGLIACQWLRHLGATVIGTVGTRAKAELAHAHGCTHPIVIGEQDFVAKVREITAGLGVGVVFDAVGKATFEGSLDCLRPRGLLVSFGNASGKPPLLDVTRLAEKGSLSVTRPTLFHYTATAEELALSSTRFFDVLRTGAVQIHIGQRWSLEQAADAQRALEERRTVGSSILVPET